MTAEQRTLTDWRGNIYTVGTVILYPVGSGGSIEIQEARVVEIWDVVNDPDTYGWARFDPDNPNHAGLKRVTRVRVKPTERCSRSFFRNKAVKTDENGAFVYDEHGRAVWEPIDAKPVIILITENITVATGTREAG
ncbi:hypothetical protein ACBJ59_57130 [Nonomuraea sp. MTCD27]|uniref:hypothetical protein n=1 Tax=Nonomuraea sp. MTCD27 TaxID=1676747 RepID=UPI0035C26BD0